MYWRKSDTIERPKMEVTYMFQKLAPLIVLALFAIGTIFIIRGLNKASEMAHPKSTVIQQGVK